jgi:hypothetical protein
MYADPVHIRSKRVNLSLNSTEMRVVEAMAELHGVQPSVFIRELAMEALKHLHGSKSATGTEEKRHAYA